MSFSLLLRCGFNMIISDFLCRLRLFFKLFLSLLYIILLERGPPLHISNTRISKLHGWCIVTTVKIGRLPVTVIYSKQLIILLISNRYCVVTFLLK